MSEKIDTTVDEFFSTIKQSLELKVPLSTMRYGDGETMMFNGKREDAAFILKKILGYVPNDEEIQIIRNNLIKAYQECDILGIPTERHLRREDKWKESIEVFKSVVGEEYLHNKERTSIDIFYDMLSKGYFQGLFVGLETLNYVSCRNLDSVFKIKFGVKNINSFIIAPEPTYTSGYTGDKHFPDQFNQVEKWIKTLDCKGVLCLVGAGIPGKLYNNWFRDQGGVSLDIGSVFDAFAGKKTRGPGRGLDAIDNTYKL